MNFLIIILFFCCSVKAATTNDPMTLDQEDLRVALRSRISEELATTKKIYSGYFALPDRIANGLPGQNVLEIGCGSGASIRAFANAKSVSIAEPDIDALAMGFSSEWTQQKDAVNLASFSYRCDETFEVYAKRMNLNTRWISDIRLGNSGWISNSVHIYPTTLENLPTGINRSFDLVAYQNFNIPSTQYESFFKRLSEIIKLNGIILIEFLGDDYRLHNSTFEGIWHGKLESCLRQYFTMESIIDELGHQDFSDEASSILINVPCIRFVLLQLVGG